VILLAGAARAGQTGQVVFVEDSFEDFADGTLDASGHNLYVSRDGAVRTIHRFDLNQDGFLDLIFNSTHDYANFVPATLATVGRDGSIGQSSLPVAGSLEAAIADLNHDGSLDVVFCPNDSGIQNPRRFLTIFWGTPKGWSGSRTNGVLPVDGARAVAVADLNGDSWPDIVALGQPDGPPGQAPGTLVRVYWGSEDGYLLTRRHDALVPSSLDLATADLDRDGADDLAVLTASEGLHVFWAERRPATPDPLPRAIAALPGPPPATLVAADIDADGARELLAGTLAGDLLVVRGGRDRTLAASRVATMFAASHLSAGDLDADGFVDLVLTAPESAVRTGQEGGIRPNSVRILWGSQAWPSKAPSTDLAVDAASATAVGDLDGDARVDLIVAVRHGPGSFSADSVLFLGRGNRALERHPTGIRTEGAVSAAIAPPEGRLPARAIFANSMGGQLREEVPLLVYWGGRNGFEPSRRWEIPFRSGYEASAADLDADGFTDLLALNSQHLGGDVAASDPHAGANIFWGGRDGFDLDGRRTVLRERNLGASHIADLDRDGYLDIVLGAFDLGRPDPTDALVVYYGSARGFGRERRVALPSEGRSLGTAIGDLDRNGFLDIAVTSYLKDLIRIFWGGPQGFSVDRQARVNVPSPIDLETADLDGDGFLDLVTGSYFDKLTGRHDTGTFIFWGAQDGFRSWRAQWLPGFTPIGHAIADFDADGYLDLFSPHYHGEVTREALPSYLFWGGPEGFSPDRKTLLVTDSAHDAMAADFDGDGRLDLAVSCHTRDGDHHTVSKVFFGDGQRFATPRIQTLPTHGTHWMWNQDMGHVYTRRWVQTYVSSIVAWNDGRTRGRLGATARTPPGAALDLAVRSGGDATALEAAAWRPLEAGRFTLSPADRVLQYRATFRSSNGDRYPVLDRVEITLEP
jgi:hypothetical protein